MAEAAAQWVTTEAMCGRFKSRIIGTNQCWGEQPVL